MPNAPRFKISLSIEAEVADAKTKQLTLDAKQMMETQAAAYVDYEIRNRLLERLTKDFRGFGLGAQMAQAAVNALFEELGSIHIELPGIQATLMGRQQQSNPVLPPLMKAQLLLPTPAAPGKKRERKKQSS